MNSKTLTLRLSPFLYAQVAAVARRRQVSLNRLVTECLEQLQKAEEEARLYQEFSLLGEDVEGCDVSYAAVAQREVISHE